MLTSAAVKAARPRSRAYKMFDERGLHLHVATSGRATWRIKQPHKHFFGGSPKICAQCPSKSIMALCTGGTRGTVERLGLSEKVLLTLKEAGIETFDELKSISPRRLARLPGIGPAALASLRSALHPYDVDRVTMLERRIQEHRRAIDALKGEIAQMKSEVLTEPRRDTSLR